jgi:hypothetical protein
VVIAVVVSAFLDIQPVAIHALAVVLRQNPALKPSSASNLSCLGILALPDDPVAARRVPPSPAPVAAPSTPAHTLRTILT